MLTTTQVENLAAKERIFPDLKSELILDLHSVIMKMTPDERTPIVK